MNHRKKLLVSLIVIAVVAGSFLADAMLQPSLFPYQIWQPKEDRMGAAQPPGPIGLIGDQKAQPLTNQERMIIYNAQISIETGEIQAVLSKIEALAVDYGGYVAGSSRSSYGTQTVAEITIRIPKDRFHAAVDQIEEFGKVLDERTASDDVTQQYVDLRARLDNLQRQEKRLQEILAMAKTVDEVLTVERELERVRGQIESLQGQIEYLEGNAEMSNVAVQLTEPSPPFTPPGMNWAEILQMALAALFAIVSGLIILAFSIIPLAVIGIPAYYVYRRRATKKASVAQDRIGQHGRR